MVTPEWSDWRNGTVWWIQSVYVAPAHRRRGVYRMLHEHVREAGRAEGVVGLRLYVDRNNLTAQNTYGVLGMSESRYIMYEEDWA
jgi:ribosomal protein S18 acetylase RimI-like enzyme